MTVKMVDLIQRLDDWSPRMMANGEVRMMCPYRENHTSGNGQMSFFLSPSKNRFFCFSCGKGGLASNVLTTRLGLTLSEALDSVQLFNEEEEVIKLRAGDDLPEYALDRPISIKPPKAYLKRGFTEETLRHFKVGSYVEDGERILTTPYYQNGILVGIKHRSEKSGRFFWTEPVTFQRKNYLYNQSDWATAVLVEGETDVWRSYQNGVKNVLATLGTALSKGQLIRLREYEDILLAYDNDESGTIATEKAYHLLDRHVNLKFVPYDAKDPGEVKSPSDWQYAVKHATDYATYTLEMTMHMGSDYTRIKNKIARKMA